MRKTVQKDSSLSPKLGAKTLDIQELLDKYNEFSRALRPLNRKRSKPLKLLNKTGAVDRNNSATPKVQDSTQVRSFSRSAAKPLQNEF